MRTCVHLIILTLTGICISCDDGTSHTPSRDSIECVITNDSGQLAGPRIPGQWGYFPEIENGCYASPKSSVYVYHSTDPNSGQDIWVGGTSIDCFCDSIGVDIILPDNIQISNAAGLGEELSPGQLRCPGLSYINFRTLYENYTVGDSLLCLYQFQEPAFDFTQTIHFVEYIQAGPAVVDVGCWPIPVDNGDSVNVSIAAPRAAIVLIKRQQTSDTLLFDNLTRGGYYVYRLPILTSESLEAITIRVGSDEFIGNVCVNH